MLIRWICLLFLLFSSAALAERPPNVILILTDDQGSVDAGCYGTPDIKTPNIDALAARGIRFTQFYAAAPVCSPSRAALMTGRYPVRAGLTGNVPRRGGAGGMPTEQVTIAETFKAAGYATALIGKWHLGHTPETQPNAQGFDHAFGHLGGCIDNFSHFFYWNGPNEHDLFENGVEIQRPGEYFPAMMVEEAGEYMAAHPDDPFFMYFALNTPHYPYQGSPEWLDYYEKAGVPYPRNLYNAFVSTMDDHIGELIAKVDSLGLRDDTIIVFQSDHGHSTEERAHFGGGHAGPYRGAKNSMFEGGLRVPAIISWPTQLPENTVRDQLAIACDWLPTVAALAGVPLVEEDIDGRDLNPLLTNAEVPTPHGVLHWLKGHGLNAQWVVRDGPWKLLGNPRDTVNESSITKEDRLFLVNLDEDIGEQTNLAKDHPETVARLHGIHKAWADSVE